MPQPGTIFGDIVETVKEHGGKAVKEIASAPLDIVKESFEQPIPNPDAERQQELKAKDEADLKAARARQHQIAQDMKPRQQPQEDRRIQQGAENAERGQTNQMAQMNNQGSQQLSASMTPKKPMQQAPAVEGKRKDRLRGAG